MTDNAETAMRRRDWIPVLALILLVALLVVGVVLLLRDMPTDRRVAENPAPSGAEQAVVKDKPVSAAETARPDGAKAPAEEIVRPAPKKAPKAKQPDSSPEEPPVAKKDEPQKSPKPAAHEELEDDVPDPEKPITVDFINRDAQTVFHYIALRSGLNIQVQGAITARMTVYYKDVKPREVINAICKTNDLECIEEGKLMYIKAKK